MKSFFFCLVILLSVSCSHNLPKNITREISSEKFTAEDKQILKLLTKELDSRFKNVPDSEIEETLQSFMIDFGKEYDEKYLAQTIGSYIYNNRVLKKNASKDPALNGMLRVLLSGNEASVKTALYFSYDLSSSYPSSFSYSDKHVPLDKYLIDYSDVKLIKSLLNASTEELPFKGDVIEVALLEGERDFLQTLEEWASKDIERAKLIAQTLDESHGEYSAIWNKEHLLPDYIAEHLRHPKKSELSKNYYKKTGKKFVEDMDAVDNPLSTMSFRDQDLLKKPEKITPKMIKEMIDDKIQRIDYFLHDKGAAFFNTPGNINGSFEGLGMFLDVALTKKKITVLEDDSLPDFLVSKNGKATLKKIRNPLILDKLEEYIVRFYVPVLPEKSEKLISIIQTIREESFGKASASAVEIAGQASTEKTPKTKPKALAGSGDSCADIAKNFFSK